MKKKILIIGMTSNYGGIENVIYNNLLKFKNEYDISFITICDKEKMAYEAELLKMNCIIYKLKNPKTHFFEFRKELKNIIKANEFDIIHINILSCANTLYYKYSKQYSKSKIIVHSHNANIPHGIIRKTLHYKNKNVYKNNEYNIACSTEAGNFMFGDNNNFELVKNQIPFDNYEYDHIIGDMLREKYSLNDKIIIGNIGRFSEQKNQKFIIELANKMQHIDQKYHFVMIGGGEYDKYKEIIENNKLTNVTQLNMMSNASKMYSMFDIFILPSLFEGLSLVALEAQVNGLKCFLSKNISKETDISSDERVEFLDLNLDVWIDNILKVKNNRFNLSSVNAEYNINNYSDIERYYLSIINK